LSGSRSFAAAGLARAAGERSIEVQPWSPVAAGLVRPGLASPVSSQVDIDDVALRLLCSGRLVLDMRLGVGGSVVAARWIHDGTNAVLVHVDEMITISDAAPLSELVDALAKEAGGLDAVPVKPSDPFNILAVRTVCLGPGAVIAGPAVELIGEPGKRSLLARNVPARQVPITVDELLILLRVSLADASVLAETDDDVMTLSLEELAAVAVFLDRSSIVAVLADAEADLDSLVSVGASRLNARSDLEALFDLFDAPDEEFVVVAVAREGTSAVVAGTDDQTGLVVERRGDDVVVIDTTRRGAIDRIRTFVDDTPVPSVIRMQRIDNISGTCTMANLDRGHDGLRDADGGDALSGIEEILREKSLSS